MGFMNSYKELDNLCKDLFSSDKGVTTYIEEMEKLKFLNDSAKRDYKNLKHYRHIRNKIAHENNANEENMCTAEDTFWIDNFHYRIIKCDDPLNLGLVNKRRSKSVKRTRTTGNKRDESLVSPIMKLIFILIFFGIVVYFAVNFLYK